MQTNSVLVSPQIKLRQNWPKSDAAAHIVQKRYYVTRNCRAVLSEDLNNSNALPEIHFVLQNMIVHGASTCTEKMFQGRRNSGFADDGCK